MFIAENAGKQQTKKNWGRGEWISLSYTPRANPGIFLQKWVYTMYATMSFSLNDMF